MDAVQVPEPPVETVSTVIIPHLRRMPAMVRDEIMNLPVDKQAAFVEEYRRKVRTPWIGYVLWFFFGLHYVYVKKWSVALIFWVTFGGLTVWWVVDLFRVPRLVRDYNKDRAIEALANLRAVSG